MKTKLLLHQWSLMTEEPTAEDYAFSYLLSYACIQMPAYKTAKMHQMIATHLEGVERGEITRLLIFTPPRHGKTMLISEFFPSWYLGRNPDSEIIYATYSHDRATDVGRKVRNQMNDDMFRTIFPECQLSPDSKGAYKLSTLQNGNYYAVGVGGATTGRGANLFIIDDPVKGAEDADSEISRRKLEDWFDAVAYTRLMPRNAIILVMTRWHYDDLAGYLLKEKSHEPWVILNLPAVAESDDDILGRKEGEALWPEHYPVPKLRQIKQSVQTRFWNALYQQRPLPAEGGLVNLKWFKYYSWKELKSAELAIKMGQPIKDSKFKFKKIVCSWDTAFKESELNDPSACTIWGVSDTDYYLLWIINQRLDFPKLKKKVVDIWNRNNDLYQMPANQLPVLIEDKASGQSLIQELKRETSLPIISIPTKNRSKEFRMSEGSALIEAGRVYLPDKAPWLVDYETQMAQFPYGKHDDLVDSTSQFLKWVGKPKRRRSRTPKYWK